MSMLFSRSIQRSFGQSIKSLVRNKWTNITTILAMTLVFLLVHVTIAFTVFAHSVLQNLERKIDIGVFFTEQVTNEQAGNFLGELDKQKEAGVIEKYTFYSKDDALKDFEKRYPDRMIYLKRYNLDNPLVDMVEILPNEGRITDLMSFLNDENYKEIVDQDFLRSNQDANRKRVENFVAIANFTKITGTAIFIFFLLSASGLVFYAVNTAARRHGKEIFIMRLVGARFSYIRMPFIVEGILIAAIAFGLSLAFAYLLFYMFFSSLKDLFMDPDLHVAFVYRANEVIGVFFSSIPWSAVSVLVLAALGSFLAIEQYLRKQSILSS